MVGCINDTGNYSYLDADEIAPVAASGIDKEYNVITLDQLIINPEIKGDESQYDYLWYAYSQALLTNPVDTLGYEKDLDYNVILAPGQYSLVFKVTDKTNQTSSFQKTNLTVSSPFGNGYFVQKYENGYTDIDFIDTDGNVNSSVLQQINGEGLTGHPVNTSYFSLGYSYQVEDEEGEVTEYIGVPGYMVCSDSDFKIYQGETMEELTNFDNAFMETPEVRQMQGVVSSSAGYMLVNNNNAHLYRSGSSTLGMFGYPYPDDSFSFSKYFISATTSFLAFDENSSQFLMYSSSKNEAITDATYNEYDLLFLGARPSYLYITQAAFALLKHKTEDKAYIVSLNSLYLSYSYFLYTEYTVPTTMAVLDASVFAIGGGNNVLYYSNGNNEVGYFNFDNQVEQTALTLPENENVVYIKNVYDALYGVNKLLVLTDNGEGWNLHIYNFAGATPDLELPATESYSGTGEPANVTYRDANVYVTY